MDRVPGYDGEAAVRVAEGSRALADLCSELRNVAGYVDETIPAGRDRTNDYWRARVAQLRELIDGVSPGGCD
jgi:hypothetical protein